jgi:hypothetical protein
MGQQTSINDTEGEASRRDGESVPVLSKTIR